MLRIRAEQMAALERHMLQQFENRLRTQLVRTWPDECRVLGEQGVRASIHEGLRKAAGYGIDAEYDVARFIHVMYALGHDFDTDPRYPWAAKILEDERIRPSERMDQVCERTEQELGGTGTGMEG